MRRAGIALLVFAVGMASLGAEIAAARLMAPWFGASTIVWANTIGVVLVALSAGYALGGRWADRHPSETGLRRLALLAALLLGAVPLVAGPLLPASARALDELDAGAFLGSLFGVSALLAVPVLLLGAASPWAIRLAVGSVEESGRVAGRLFALSTVGSLTGTFLSALVLVPFIGTQRTFVVFAAALALAAAPGLGRIGWGVAALTAAALALPPGVTKPDAAGTVIHERETPYQYVRVVERPSGARVLELNEGHAAHSVWRKESVLTDGVWDGYLVLPLAALGRPPRRVAMLGNAAGTVARAYGALLPRTMIDGVEIDPALSEVGRRYMGMRNPRLRVHHADARPFLRQAGRYDLIAVDAYRQPYIPFYLTTREFFSLARSRLVPGGALIVNAGQPEGETALERVLAAGMRSSFAHVARWPIEARNTLLIASDVPLGTSRLLAAARELGPTLAPLARRAAAELEPALRGGEVYTDDRAPVEWLIDTSIVRYAAG